LTLEQVEPLRAAIFQKKLIKKKYTQELMNPIVSFRRGASHAEFTSTIKLGTGIDVVRNFLHKTASNAMMPDPGSGVESAEK